MERKKMLVDIGGTPDNVLSQDKASIAYRMGIKPEQLVIILDPINQARQTRTLVLGDFSTSKIKFGVEKVNDPDFSAEEVPAPKYEEVKEKFSQAKSAVLGALINKYNRQIKDKKKLEERYDKLSKDIADLTKKSANMREFMNSLVEYLFYPIKVIKMEDVFSKNPDVTYDIIKKVEKIGWLKKEKDENGVETFKKIYKIPTRAICPLDKLFVSNYLGDDLGCCGVKADDVIRSGRFIPEEGFFPIFVYLNGYKMFLQENHAYVESTQKLLKDFGFEKTAPFVVYSSSEPKVAKFESKLMEGMLKDEKN